MSAVAATEFAPSTGKFAIGFEGALALSGIAVLLVTIVLGTGRGSFAEKTDFSSIYIGARIVHQGEGAKLYSLEEQGRLRASLFKHPNPQIYDHPAYEVVFLAPLASMPYGTAYIVWGLVNVFLWLFLPCLIRRMCLFPGTSRDILQSGFSLRHWVLPFTKGSRQLFSCCFIRWYLSILNAGMN